VSLKFYSETLEFRRRDDLIKHFKIIREMERTDKEQLFLLVGESRTWGTLDFRQCLGC